MVTGINRADEHIAVAVVVVVSQGELIACPAPCTPAAIVLRDCSLSPSAADLSTNVSPASVPDTSPSTKIFTVQPISLFTTVSFSIAAAGVGSPESIWRAATARQRFSRAGTSTDSANGLKRAHYLPIGLVGPDESVEFERICRTIYNHNGQPHTLIGMNSTATFHGHRENKP